MRKTLLTTALAISATLCMSAAPFKVTVTPLGEKPADSMLKAPAVSKADVIVNEDFSGFTEGETLDVNKWGEQMCSYYSSEEIDPSLTHGAQWTGHNVHQAGGCAGLFDINVQDPAYINTPKMDYSGSVTITFLAKSLLTEWEEEDENGEMKKWHFSSTTIMMRMATDDYNVKFDYGSDDFTDYAGNFDSFPIYPHQGWCKIKIEFDNYSAYNDAFFQIASAGHLLIDDLKITTSVDKFIAEPVFKGFTGATEDSFTISFESVRKAFNYYTYLYELDGQDENGNPIYKTVIIPENLFSPEQLEQIAQMGMTVDEYLHFMAEQMGMTYDELMEMMVMDKPYNNFGEVHHVDGTNEYTFTYTNLDPTKQYYFDIRSHYYRAFSPENIRPVEVVGTPTNLDATDISETGFTANWSKITKCDGYTVDLYGVNVVEDEDNFVIFEEDFDATEELTDSTDINNPDATGEGSDITFDDLTSSPGWVFGDDNYILIVKGKAGLGVDDYGCFRLTSPTMYVAGADMATLSLSVKSTIEDYELRIRFAGQVYSLPVEGNKFEGEIELPTFGLKETNFAISGPDEAPIFIDYISVSQPLQKGDMTFTWLGREETDKETLSYAFSDLDPERFGRYAFSANAFRGEDDKKMSSFDGERIIVDLKNCSSSSQFSEVEEVMAAVEIVEVARYTLDGQCIDKPVKGINITRYSDGSVRKVMVK